MSEAPSRASPPGCRATPTWSACCHGRSSTTSASTCAWPAAASRPTPRTPPTRGAGCWSTDDPEATRRLLRAGGRGGRPPGLGRVVRRHRPAGRGGVPDAHPAAAHPRGAAGAGRRRRGLDRVRRAPAGDHDHGVAAQRPRARRRRDRRADRHAHRARRPVTAREPVLPLPRDRQRDRTLGRARRRHGHGHGRPGARGAAGRCADRHGSRGDRRRPGGGRVAVHAGGEERTAHGARVLAGVAPWALERLCPGACPGPRPEGAQVKVNLLLRRLPALHDPAVPPRPRSPAPCTSTRRTRSSTGPTPRRAAGGCPSRCRARPTATR